MLAPARTGPLARLGQGGRRRRRHREELASNGVSVDLVPDRYLADALVQAFPPPVAPGAGSVLLPCAAGAGDVLAKGLADKGWQVKVVEAYRTLRPSLDRGAIARSRL